MAQFRSKNYLDLIKVLASTYRQKIKERSGVEGIKKGIKSRSVESHIWGSLGQCDRDGALPVPLFLLLSHRQGKLQQLDEGVLHLPC